jgi:hypothetical protein
MMRKSKKAHNRTLKIKKTMKKRKEIKQKRIFRERHSPWITSMLFSD